MRRDPTPAWVALVLAIGVAVALIALATGAAIIEASDNGSLSTEASALLSTVLGAAVGAIATYLGLGARGADESPELPADEQPTGEWPPTH